MLIARPPRPRLRPFVERVWANDPGGEKGPGDRAVEHVLPTGAMHLVFRLEGPALRLLVGPGDSRGDTLGHATVGGARATYYVRDVSVPSASVGAMLRPGAAALLFGATAGELAGRHTPLEDLWGLSARVARDRLLEARGPERRLAILEALLASRLPEVRGLHPSIAYSLERFDALEGVRAVVNATGYSHRHFLAMFRGAVGLPPKTYCRVLRFQRALRRAAASPRAPWAGIASEAGYSDQAHLHRDFLEFAGVTPAAYRRIAPPLLNHVALPPAPRLPSPGQLRSRSLPDAPVGSTAPPSSGARR